MNKGQNSYQLLEVDKIELDKSNPRIAKWIEMHGDNIPAEQMALALGAGCSTEGAGGPSFGSLKQSIMTNKGIIHPIIVNKDAQSNYIVIEGNTRTLIYKEFNDNGVKGDWSNIPSMVYEQMSPEMVDAIRLQAHLVGTRQWDPYSKARYLDFLRSKQHLTFAQIVDFCGGAKREVENYIQAFNDMEKHYRPIVESDQDFDHTRFSSFVELQATRVLEAIFQAKFTKGDFAKWVYEDKLSPQHMVRKLPRILLNQESREIFLREDAQEAIKVLDVPTSEAAISSATLEQLCLEVCKRISGMKYSYVKRLRDGGALDEKELIRDARDSLDGLCSDILEQGEK